MSSNFEGVYPDSLLTIVREDVHPPRVAIGKKYVHFEDGIAPLLLPTSWVSYSFSSFFILSVPPDSPLLIPVLPHEGLGVPSKGIFFSSATFGGKDCFPRSPP